MGWSCQGSSLIMPLKELITRAAVSLIMYSRTSFDVSAVYRSIAEFSIRIY